MLFISTLLGLVAAVQSKILTSSETAIAKMASLNSLSNITIFGTGGTIAGSASLNTQTTGYTPGTIGVRTLVDAVPAILNIANINAVQVINFRSTEVTSQILLGLSREINTAPESKYCQGIVVTHGTDMLEETAFFLSSTVRSSKPVVIVGAIRPATALSADGPLNMSREFSLLLPRV